MKNISPKANTVIRVKLIIPIYIRDKQLPELMAHIEDVVTTIAGLYTQMAMILIGEAQKAYSYEETALSFLEEYYYTAMDKISRDKVGDERSIVTFDQYPFT